MAKTVLQNWSLVAQFLPLLPVLVDHPDVVVDVRTSLAVVDIGRVVRTLGGVTAVLEHGVDVVLVVEVDQGEVHEALLTNHGSVPDRFTDKFKQILKIFVTFFVEK